VDPSVFLVVFGRPLLTTAVGTGRGVPSGDRYHRLVEASSGAAYRTIYDDAVTRFTSKEAKHCLTRPPKRMLHALNLSQPT